MARVGGALGDDERLRDGIGIGVALVELALQVGDAAILLAGLERGGLARRVRDGRIGVVTRGGLEALLSFLGTGKGGVVYPVEKRRRPVFTSTVVTYPPPPRNASRIQVVVVLPLVPVMP